MPVKIRDKKPFHMKEDGNIKQIGEYMKQMSI